MRRSASGRGRKPPPDAGRARVRAARRAAAAAAVAALPAALALAAAAAAGALDPAGAAGLWLLIAAAMAAGLWPAAAAIDAAAAWTGRLAAGPEPGPPAESALPGLGAPLRRALARLAREWRERRAETADAIAAMEAILDALPDPLLLLDDANRVAFANRAAQAAFGRALAGRPLAAAIRAPALLAAAERAAGEPASARFEVESDSGARTVWDGRLAAIGAGAADGPRVLLALRDVTAHERGERLRAEFVANASHEIRTPLTTLVGAIETLRGPARDDAGTRERFLAMMADHAARIGRLVDGLLSLSRIESAERAPPAGAVDLRPVLERAAEALAWRARERGARVTLDIDPAAPPVAGDADELELAFRNLIDNAIKYGPEGGEVRVAAAPDGGGARVTVSDDGPGVAAEHVPRLTERFYRVDKARAGPPGAGLGLAIVKHVARRCGGALDIASEAGRGGRFTLRLRRAPPESSDTGTPPIRESLDTGNRAT